MNHRYNSEQLENGKVRLTCPQCGRVVVISLDPYERWVEISGEPYAGHEWTMSGMEMQVELP